MTYSDLTVLFLRSCMIPLGACMLACLIRTAVGPRISDRLVGVNMTGTLVMALIALLSICTEETGFLDIAIICALLSFISVAVFTKLVGRRKDGK